MVAPTWLTKQRSVTEFHNHEQNTINVYGMANGLAYLQQTDTSPLKAEKQVSPATRGRLYHSIQHRVVQT